MREVDPIRNPSDALLSAALHRLATGSPQDAPAELGAELAQAFRRHHRRRKQARMAAITAMAACLALVAALLAMRKPAVHKATPLAVQQQLAVNPGTEPPLSQQAEAQEPSRPASQTRPASAASSAGEDGFVTLDAYDPATTSGDLQVVRLELSGADLRMIGAPVTEDLSDRRLLADVVVDEDGTPYAVRLVR
jgi:hypothetical protein